MAEQFRVPSPLVTRDFARVCRKFHSFKRRRGREREREGETSREFKLADTARLHCAGTCKKIAGGESPGNCGAITICS